MILTAHAQERLAQRGIPAPAIMATALHGEQHKQEGGQVRVEFMGFAIVVGPGGELITTFETDRLPRATSPKREARRNRMLNGRFRRENRGGRIYNEKWGGC